MIDRRTFLTGMASGFVIAGQSVTGGPIAVEEQIARQIIDLDPDADPQGMERAYFDARADFGAFMGLMFPGYLGGWHIDRLQEVLSAVERREIDRLIITLPPRHSKSMHVSEGFPAWYMGRHPDHRVIAASHTQELANKFSYRVRQKFDDMHWPFRNVRIADDKGKVQAWDIAGSPTGGYVAVGTGGSPTGLGADLIIIDDPFRNQADAESPTIRERTWEWFQGTIYTRRQPGAAIIVTATRWHEDDLTGRLIQQMRDGGEHWEHVHMPAEADDGTYLWPEFWSDVEYEKAKAGSDRVWLAQYQGTPTRKGGNLLLEEWFPAVTPGETYVGIIQAWDTAEKPGVTNDYSVCATIGLGLNSYDVLHIWRDRVQFPELLQAAQDQATWVQSVYPNLPYTLAIEDKSSGTQLIQTLRASTRLPVVDVPANTTDQKIQRVIRNTAIAKARRIRVLLGASWRSDFMREVKGFPTEAHDDIVDAVMIGVDQATGADQFAVVTRNYLEQKTEVEATTGRRRYRPPVSPP